MANLAAKLDWIKWMVKLAKPVNLAKLMPWQEPGVPWQGEVGDGTW